MVVMACQMVFSVPSLWRLKYELKICRSSIMGPNKFNLGVMDLTLGLSYSKGDFNQSASTTIRETTPRMASRSLRTQESQTRRDAAR